MDPQQSDSSDKPEAPVTPQAPSSSEAPSGGPGKSKLVIGIIIVVVILLVVGAVLLMNNKSDNNGSSNSNSSSQGGNSSDTYVSEEGGFSLTKPAGWVQGETPNLGTGKGVIYQPPGATQEDLSVILVASYPMPEGKTLSQVIEEGKEFGKSFPNFTVVETKELKHNGNDAMYIEATYTVSGQPIRQSQLAVVKGGMLYTVTVTLPEAEWAANQERAQAVRDSLKVE